MKFVIVTGMSGAGKTTVLKFLEDMDFFCVDNLPPALITKFSQLCFEQDGSIDKVALGIDIRGGKLFKDLFKSLEDLKTEGYDYEILFLDASDSTLIKRYKETRRTHPILISNKASTLVEAIEYERKLARPISKEANMVIDTTHLKGNKFQQLLENQFNHQSIDPFRISFVSFGYKHGIPKDADLLFDVRFLPNPFYIEELRNLTGNDKEVYDYVIDKPETQVFIQKMTNLLDYLLEEYDKEGKTHVVIGIGCTGGQHRSVSLTNYFADHYSQKYHVHRLHRDAVH